MSDVKAIFRPPTPFGFVEYNTLLSLARVVLTICGGILYLHRLLHGPSVYKDKGAEVMIEIFIWP